MTRLRAIEDAALALHAGVDRRARRHPVPGLRHRRGLVRVDGDAVQRHVLLAAARGDAEQLPHGPRRRVREHAGDGHAARKRETSLTSLVVGFGTVVLALVVAVPAAYALSKYRLRVTVVLVSSLLVAQIVPSIVLATSLFVVFHWIHLVNTYPALILADGTYAIPFAILVLRAFFFSLPNDLMYAARVDGASEWQTFRLIILPLARSAVITVAIFAFLAGWGDFIFALTILNGSGIQPVTLGIFNYLGNYSTDWGAVMAAAGIAMVPAALMLVVAQRYIATGLTAGSVKG